MLQFIELSFPQRLQKSVLTTTTDDDYDNVRDGHYDDNDNYDNRLSVFKNERRRVPFRCG